MVFGENGVYIFYTPAQRRLRLLELAEQFGFAIVEDDYDHEFHFDRQPMLPIAAFDRYHKVIYVGSLSRRFWHRAYVSDM